MVCVGVGVGVFHSLSQPLPILVSISSLRHEKHVTAREKGFPELDYLLLPKPKGFCFVVNSMRDDIDGVCVCVCVCPLCMCVCVCAFVCVCVFCSLYRVALSG